MRLRLGAVVLAVVLAACSGGGDLGGGQPPGSAGGPAVGFSLSAFDVHAAAPVAPEVVERAKAGVLTTLDAYLQRAVLAPLSPNGAVGDLGPVFTAPAATRLTGPDRAALVEEGVAGAEGPPQVAAAIASVAVLVDAGGRPVMAGAHLDLRVRADTDEGPLVVDRQGDFALVAEGDAANPVWKVDSYDIRTTRGTPRG